MDKTEGKELAEHFGLSYWEEWSPEDLSIAIMRKIVVLEGTLAEIKQAIREIQLSGKPPT